MDLDAQVVEVARGFMAKVLAPLEVCRCAASMLATFEDALKMLRLWKMHSLLLRLLIFARHWRRSTPLHERNAMRHGDVT